MLVLRLTLADPENKQTNFNQKISYFSILTCAMDGDKEGGGRKQISIHIYPPTLFNLYS